MSKKFSHPFIPNSRKRQRINVWKLYLITDTISPVS